MKFQILHESRGRVRLRAMQRSMSMRDADLLEAWILALPGVCRVFYFFLYPQSQYGPPLARVYCRTNSDTPPASLMV